MERHAGSVESLTAKEGVPAGIPKDATFANNNDNTYKKSNIL